MYRIGVDVGGTNTDAAILDITATSAPSRGVLASSKSPTTPDITSGIKGVVEDVLRKSAVDVGSILSVAIGTTHFVNAVVEADARRLSKVAVVRLCGPFTRQVGSALYWYSYCGRVVSVTWTNAGLGGELNRLSFPLTSE